jgi:hypothetical protein
MPVTYIEMSPGDFEEEQWSDVDSDEDSDEDNYADSDEESEHDSDMPDGSILSRGDLADSVLSDFEMDEGECMTYITGGEDEPYTKEEYEASRRWPAILRANRQIYAEASDMLYAEAILVLEPTDVLALAKRPFDLEFGIAGENGGVWRHHPFKDPGVLQLNGTLKYKTPELDGGGKMYPHVFRRFKKIYFDATFDIEETGGVELWIDDDTYVVREDTAEAFKEMLQDSPLMQDFVKLISLSPVIISLEISLELEIMANSNLRMQDEDEDEDEDDENQEATELKIDRLMAVANERATEIFLDSGICDPLWTLKNVKNFSLNFGFIRDEEAGEEEYKPLPRHVKLIKEMKEKIETSFEELTASA